MSEKAQYIKSGIFSYSGKIIVIISGFLYTLLIANHLGPADYGLVNYYISLILGLIGISGIAFLNGLVIVFMPKWRSRKLYVYSLFIIFIISLVLFSVIFLFSKEIAAYLGKANYDLLKLTSILLLISPFTLSFAQLFKSFKMFGKEFKFNIVVNTLNLAIAFFLVILLNYGVYGVIYSMILANFVGLIYLIYQSRQLVYVNRPIDFAEIKKYCFFGVPATFLRRVNDQILILLMGFFIIDSDLGLYYIAFKIASLIISTPADTLSEVLLPYMSSASKDKGKLSRYISLNIKFSLILTCALSIFVALFSKTILSLLFPRYVEAYPFILLLSVMAIMSSFNPLESLFSSLNRVDMLLKSRACWAVATIIFGLILVPTFGVTGLIMTQILGSIVNRSMLLYFSKTLGLKIETIPKKHDFIYFRDTFNNVIISKLKNHGI